MKTFKTSTKYVQEEKKVSSLIGVVVVVFVVVVVYEKIIKMKKIEIPYY